MSKDIATLSDKELREELKRRDQQKIEDRRAYKDLVEETIPGMVKGFKGVSDTLQQIKVEAYSTLRDIMNMKFDLYNAKDEQQSHTFSDSKGNGISIGYYVNDNWDDTVNTGIAKVNNYIKRLSNEEQNKDVITIVNRLLKKDKKGNLKSSRVLELMGLAEEIEDAEFLDGVQVIKDAYKPTRSKFFIQAFTTGTDGSKNYIPLSITTVDFPNDFDFSFMLPEKLRS